MRDFVYSQTEARGCGMKRILLIFLCILIASAFFIGGFFALLFGSYERVETDIAKYSDHLHGIGSAERMMPALDSLGNYASLEYSYKVHCYSTFVGFFSDGYALCVTYDESQYEHRKTEALTSYAYLQEPAIAEDGDYLLPVTELDYKGFTLKIVPDEDQFTYCPCKSFMMIGFNDTEYKILYLYYYDFDIDYIAAADEDPVDEMTELIEDAFAWIE